MSGLVALGAGIAALTAVLVFVLHLARQLRLSAVSRKLTARFRRTCCWALHWQKVLQFLASSLHC